MLLFHRKIIFGVEIDFILFSPDAHITFLEVKTMGAQGLWVGRLSRPQERRLRSAKMFFESVYQIPVEVRLAFVEAKTSEVTEFVIL